MRTHGNWSCYHSGTGEWFANPLHLLMLASVRFLDYNEGVGSAGVVNSLKMMPNVVGNSSTTFSSLRRQRRRIADRDNRDQRGSSEQLRNEADDEPEEE